MKPVSAEPRPRPLGLSLLWVDDGSRLTQQANLGVCVPCRKELAEAHRTNKPCGKCHFYLLISKTFVEAGKSNSKKKWSDPKKEELMFANAEEEFFYEVRPSWFICLHVMKDFPDI